MNEATMRVALAPRTRVCRCCNEEKDISLFSKNAFGYIGVCKECLKKHRKERREKKNEEDALRRQIDEKRRVSLSEYTPRELMAELKRRGYKFTMEYVEKHVINSKDIEI